MPTADQHSSSTIVRLLNLGESGTGKSGALASLVTAGYNLWLLDFDNGIDIIVNAVRHHYRDDPAGLSAALRRIHYETLRDSVVMLKGVPHVKAATAWKRAGEVLNEWNVANLTSLDVVAVDTLNTASGCAMNHALMLGARLNKRPADTDFGWMGDSVLLFIDALTADTPFNVVVNTHVRYLHGAEEVTTNARGQEVAGGSMRGLPQAKGQMIPREVGKFFNTTVSTRSVGTGPSTRRLISTKPQGVVEVKTSNPWGVEDTYSIEDGLGALFADILGHGPLQSTSTDSAIQPT